jgi:hypothetical protein
MALAATASSETAFVLHTPLRLETRATVETACAAFHLHRKPQTLRLWATLGTGPLQPHRVNGRLMWNTDALRALCDVAPAAVPSTSVE